MNNSSHGSTKENLRLREKTQYTILMDIIQEWPEWKLEALCLDESDLTLKKMIDRRKREKAIV